MARHELTDMPTNALIPAPPMSLDWPALGERWFHWSRIAACFWPGPGKKSKSIDPELADIKDYGGVYLIAWSEQEPPRRKWSKVPSVKYIGETHWFKARMGGFAQSAGFKGERAFGHSAAWRWEQGKNSKLWVAFFDVTQGQTMQPHLAIGLRRWVEAVALEEYRLANGALPELNVARGDYIVELAD
jgi:hypothetical protein